MDKILEPAFVYAVVIPIALSLTFAILSRLIPEKDRPPLENYDLDFIRKKFKLIETLFNISFFTITPVIVLILTKVMISVQQRYLANHLENALFRSGVHWGAFATPSIFLSLLIYGVIGDFIFQFLGRRKADTDEEWRVFYFDMNRRQAGGKEIDTNKVAILFSVFAIPLFIATFFLGVLNYSAITEENLIYNKYFSLTDQKYSYSQVNKILYIDKFQNKQSGEIEPTSPYYAILMNDGFRWITLNLDISRTPEERKIIDFISEKSGVEIVSGVHNIDDKL